MLLFNDTCITKCPINTFSFNSICLSCPNNCVTCLNNYQCLTCITGYFFTSINYLCTLLCPDGFYNDSISCFSCPVGCKSCDSKICITCIDGYVLSINQCLSKCLQGFYSNIDNICLSCSAPCLSCYVNPSKCLSCLTGYNLFNNSCVSSCSVGYYSDSSSNSCKNCLLPCLICTSSINCLKCFPYYQLDSSNKCVS
jgi:hypothetical protein